ncbi:MAG: hypothetical protein WD045_08365 [Pirellulaceae bacterium]
MLCQTAMADRVILRDLTILNNVTVNSYDEDGVQVTDHGLVPWDEIEQASLEDEAKQAEFNRLLEELGTPLFRIRQRLSVGDYAGAAEPAEAVYPRYRDRNSPTAYMVVQAAMWGRLASGNRESALEAYLACFRHLRNNPKSAESLPGDRTLQFDPKTGFCDGFEPIFFDREAAQKALPGTRRIAQGMGSPTPPGILIYYASLAQTAEDWESADRVIQAIPTGDKPGGEWRELLEIQRLLTEKKHDEVIEQLAGKVESLPAKVRPIAYYYLGKAKAASDTPSMVRDGVVDLLHIPALASGGAYRQLSAAALYEARRAFERLKEPEPRASVQRELLQQYSETYHAALLQSEG